MVPFRFGPYLLLKLLGRGASGDVYLARPIDAQRGIPSPVVVKRLHPVDDGKEMFFQRFSHEVQIATAIDSPHVAKVYDAGCVGDLLYIAMEYIAGWPLSRVLDEHRKNRNALSIASVGDVIEGVLRGLIALHSAKSRQDEVLGIVHRDLSPRNIMVGEDGVIRLIDFGVGKSRLQSFKTGTGAIVGSPGYMPPEQVRAEAIDQRADIYAAGCILFEMLTLEPFIAPGPIVQVVQASLAPKFRAPSSMRADVPDGLDTVVAKMLAPLAKDRYPQAIAVLAELRRVIPDRHQGTHLESLLGDMAWHELSQAKTDISECLTQSLTDLSDPEPTSPIEDTVVLAQAKIVRMSDAVRFDPLYVPPTQTRPGAYYPATVRAEAPKRTGLPASIQAALILALPLTLIVGVWLGRSMPTPSPSAEIAPPTSVEAHAKQAVSAVPREEEPVAKEAEVERPARTRSSGARKASQAPVIATEEKETHAAAVEETPDEMIDRLLSRSRALLKRSPDGSAKHKAAEDLIGELYVLRASARGDNKRASAKALAERLDALER